MRIPIRKVLLLIVAPQRVHKCEPYYPNGTVRRLKSF
jgi:hypothetical protein